MAANLTLAIPRSTILPGTLPSPRQCSRSSGRTRRRRTMSPPSTISTLVGGDLRFPSPCRGGVRGGELPSVMTPRPAGTQAVVSARAPATLPRDLSFLFPLSSFLTWRTFPRSLRSLRVRALGSTPCRPWRGDRRVSSARPAHQSQQMRSNPMKCGTNAPVVNHPKPPPVRGFPNKCRNAACSSPASKCPAGYAMFARERAIHRRNAQHLHWLDRTLDICNSFPIEMVGISHPGHQPPDSPGKIT